MRASLSRLLAQAQVLLPTRTLSWFIFCLTRISWPWIKNVCIRSFMRAYRISLEEAELKTPESFKDFNDFFTRALKPGARPIEPAFDQLISPVDGRVSQLGTLDEDRIFQAKGHRYSATELLGGDPELAAPFHGGRFCTIYLAPHNYHRVHMPANGRLREWVYVPGRLFSVNPTSTAQLPGLFARNERMVAIFDSDLGPLAVVMVGALFVGSLETTWAGRISPPHRRGGVDRYAPGGQIHLSRGQELGRFNMGSTVILLAGHRSLRWLDGIEAESELRMGSAIARVIDQ